jgi:hypothetical protein
LSRLLRVRAYSATKTTQTQCYAQAQAVYDPPWPWISENSLDNPMGRASIVEALKKRAK